MRAGHCFKVHIRKVWLVPHPCRTISVVLHYYYVTRGCGVSPQGIRGHTNVLPPNAGTLCVVRVFSEWDLTELRYHGPVLASAMHAE